MGTSVEPSLRALVYSHAIAESSGITVDVISAPADPTDEGKETFRGIDPEERADFTTEVASDPEVLVFFFKGLRFPAARSSSKRVFSHCGDFGLKIGVLTPRVLALLWQIYSRCVFSANPFSAARASLRRWSSDEFEDGLAHGGQCRSRRRPIDSFFPALLF